MGIRGKKPKPTRLKILNGNPGRRPLPKDEPRPARGAPPAPEWLDAYARAEWDRVVPALDKIGILTWVDGFVLEAYCTCYGRWVQHEQVIAKLGSVYSPSKQKGSKYLQQLPHISIAKGYLDEARALATELGLTPSSRARLGSPQVIDPNDPLEEFFRRNGK